MHAPGAVYDDATSWRAEDVEKNACEKTQPRLPSAHSPQHALPWSIPLKAVHRRTYLLLFLYTHSTPERADEGGVSASKARDGRRWCERQENGDSERRGLVLPLSPRSALRSRIAFASALIHARIWKRQGGWSLPRQKDGMCNASTIHWRIVHVYSRDGSLVLRRINFTRIYVQFRVSPGSRNGQPSLCCGVVSSPAAAEAATA